MLQIHVYKNGTASGKFHLSMEHFPAIIGRSEDATVRIDDRAVSRQHAQISLAGEKLILTDLGSGNGTYVGERPIDTKVIEHKAEATIGTIKLVFELDAKMKPTKPASVYDSIPDDDSEGTDMTMKVGKSAMREVITRKATEKPARLEQEPGKRVIQLRSSLCFIGKSAGADIIVPGWRVAARHALVVKDGTTWRVYDLTGKGRVLMNGEPIDGAKLSDQSTFELPGGHTFRFRESGVTEELDEDYKQWFKE